MAKRQIRAGRSVWEDQSTEYNPDAPAVVLALRRERWKRRALQTIAWGVLPVCLVTAFATNAAVNANTAASNTHVSSTSVNASAGKAAAYAAVQEWLSAVPSPLPGAGIVSWDGFAVETAPEPDPDDTAKAPTYRFETHTFTLARGTQLYTAAIQVAVDGDASAVVTSTPTLTPIVSASIDDQLDTWFGFDTANASASVSDAVTAWADAFTSGDADELRRAVQDKDSAHTYVPLTGVDAVISATIIAAADVPTGDDNVKPTQMILRVEVSVWWDGEKPADETSTTKPKPITYDLLVDDADTASPFVVAWGAVGSAPTLKPHSNALTGVKLAEPRDEPNSPTPAPTETPSDEGE